jgi:hypothetical protein
VQRVDTGKKHPLTSKAQKAPSMKVELFTTPVFKDATNSPHGSFQARAFISSTPAANLPKSSPRKELVSGLNVG